MNSWIRALTVVGGALLLSACCALSGSRPPPVTAPADGIDQLDRGPFDGDHWRLEAVTGGALEEFADLTRITLGFSEGRAFGNAGCNRYFAAYRVRDAQLLFARPGATMMYCAGDAMDIEAAFLALLEQAFEYRRGAGVLDLEAADGTRLHFVAAAAPE